tara:strand:+ start:599 stop:1504 length:906 start_codon:yes stop_codon:yes gene_type:complete
MLERRAWFLANFDWVRTGLMFEPRGHEVMSGSILYPPTREDCDVGVLFIEVSGCLPMCGHGAIGTVTVAIEEGLVTPREQGLLRLDTPAGRVEAHYHENDGHVDAVKILNVPSFLQETDIEVDVPQLGPLKIDVAFGGNYYAIIEKQGNFSDMADITPLQIQQWSPCIRQQLNQSHNFVHPIEPDIRGLSHVMWTGQPTQRNADYRNAVFYGDKAIDRSPCGTGTSARMAQLASRGELELGDTFVHESIISSIFTGCFEEETTVGGFAAIIPSIEGWAQIHGHNVITIDERDPFAHGFILV